MISRQQLVKKLAQIGFGKEVEVDGLVICHSSLSSNAVTFSARKDYTLLSARQILADAGCRGDAAQAWLEATAEENKTAEE